MLEQAHIQIYSANGGEVLDRGVTHTFVGRAKNFIFYYLEGIMKFEEKNKHASLHQASKLSKNERVVSKVSLIQENNEIDGSNIKSLTDA